MSLDLPQGMNSIFVALIPKVANSVSITDFRPIIMGNFVYKIFIKVIPTRMGTFTRDVLSPSQFEFIPG